MLCDPIWHVSSRSGEASCELLYSVYLTFTFRRTEALLTQDSACGRVYLRVYDRLLAMDNFRRHLKTHLFRAQKSQRIVTLCALYRYSYLLKVAM